MHPSQNMSPCSPQMRQRISPIVLPPERKGSVCGLLRCDHLPQEEISDDLEEFLDRRLHLWRDRMPLGLTVEVKHHRPTRLDPKLHARLPDEREAAFGMESQVYRLHRLLSPVLRNGSACGLFVFLLVLPFPLKQLICTQFWERNAVMLEHRVI